MQAPNQRKEVAIFDGQTGEDTGRKIILPEIFNQPFRPDVIKRAVLSSRSARRQPYGVDPRAGKKTSAESWGTGRGAARVPRVKGSHHHAGSRGAFAPMTIGGRRTHPPQVRSFKERITKKERWLAISSAVAATGNPSLVESRGHIIDDVPETPLIVSDSIQSIQKTKDVVNLFVELGIQADIDKAKRRTRKVRSGKGKMRGRKYKNAKSALIVIPSQEEKKAVTIIQSARNLSGVDIAIVDHLNAELLAPGTHAGRLTVWSESVINYFKDLEEESQELA